MFIGEPSESSTGNDDDRGFRGYGGRVRRIHKQSRLRHVEASRQAIVAFDKRLCSVGTDDRF